MVEDDPLKEGFTMGFRAKTLIHGTLVQMIVPFHFVSVMFRLHGSLVLGGGWMFLFLQLFSRGFYNDLHPRKLTWRFLLETHHFCASMFFFRDCAPQKKVKQHMHQ